MSPVTFSILLVRKDSYGQIDLIQPLEPASVSSRPMLRPGEPSDIPLPPAPHGIQVPQALGSCVPIQWLHALLHVSSPAVQVLHVLLQASQNQACACSQRNSASRRRIPATGVPCQGSCYS